MPEHVRVVETRFVPVDKTSGVLEKIAEKAEHADHKLEHLSEIIGEVGMAGGSLAGALALGKLTETTTDYMRSLQRIKTETGLATQKAAGLKEALEVGGGLEGGEAERILLSMSRKALQFHQDMQGGGTRDEMKRLGVDMKKGPEASLLKMAELAEKGKLSSGQVSRGLGIRSTAAVSLLEMLQKGPEAMKKIEEETIRINDSDLKTFTRMQTLRREIKNAWEDIGIVVGKEIMPAVEQLMILTKNKLEGWLDTAKNFGTILGAHMEGALKSVTAIGKVLLANFALQKMTGSGIIGGAMRLGGWILPEGRFTKEREHKLGPELHSEHGVIGSGSSFNPMNLGKRLDEMELQHILRRDEIQQKASGPIAARWGQIKSRAGDTMESMKRGFDHIQPAVAGMARLAGIGVGVWAAASTIMGIIDSINGVKSQSADNWKSAADNMKILGELSATTFGPEGWMHKFMNDPTSAAANIATGAATNLMVEHQAEQVYKAKMDALTREGAGPFDPRRRELYLRHDDIVGAAASEILARAKADASVMKFSVKEVTDLEGAAKEKNGPPVFNNARFDILMKFEEGYDPDRIAAAFADDVAALGERAVQSGFSPLYSVHS